MADDDQTKKNVSPVPEEETSQAEVPATRTPMVLAGTENYKAGDLQIGLALRMKSSGVPSTLMIPDVTKVTKGGEGGEVYITKPLRLAGTNLKKFLVKKGILTPKDHSSRFAVGDLKNPTRLVLKLYQAEDPVSQFLKTKFSKETRKLLDESQKNPGPPSAALQEALIQELNKLLNETSLYDQDRFEGVTLSESTRQLIGKGDLQGEMRFHLNRLLLEQAYPQEIAPEDREVNEPLGKFLQIVEISLEAFYFNKTGPWLMHFNLKTESEDGKGIIGTLADPDLGELFDVLGASVRVFKCNDADQYKVLQRYAALLSAE